MHISYRYKLLIVALLAAGIMLCQIASKDYGYDFLMILYVFLCIPVFSTLILVVALCLHVSKIHIAWRRLLGAMVLYWIVTGAMLRTSSIMHEHLRWLFYAQPYRTQVLAQPQRFTGQLRFAEWDEWGASFSGANVFLVYDEHDVLHHPKQANAAAQASAFPCEITSATRLAPHWYSVPCFY